MSIEMNTLSNMLTKYKIVIESKEENLMGMAVVASCIKDFIGYCWVKNLITKDVYDNAYSFNIVSDKSEHMRFYLDCKNLIDGQPSETV